MSDLDPAASRDAWLRGGSLAVTDDQRRRARAVVAKRAVGWDAEVLLAMLGLDVSTDRTCHRSESAQTP